MIGPRSIKVYDDVFDFPFRYSFYDYLENSAFRIGWSDRSTVEKDKDRFLHVSFSQEDLDNCGILEKIYENKEISQDLQGLTLTRVIGNLDTISDSHFVHIHDEKVGLLYYADLEWQNGWHGETIFYDDTLKNIVFASPYVPGRILVFDGAIPHAARPPSPCAKKFRFTMSLFFN